MLSDKPVIELVKLPVPVPSVVVSSATVGVGLVLQHTPRAVTVAPPSDVMVPPLCAVVCDIALTSAVVKTGETTGGCMIDTVLGEQLIPDAVTVTVPVRVTPVLFGWAVILRLPSVSP